MMQGFRIHGQILSKTGRMIHERMRLQKNKKEMKLKG